MGVLDFGGDRRRRRDSYGGELGASHCNQWGLCDALFANYFEDLLLLARGSLSIQYNVSALGIEMSPIPSVSLSPRKVYCGKTADPDAV